ncbi:MAG: endolytic transglycosylase MltG, partial [Lachnospiraceae bacterium]
NPSRSSANAALNPDKTDYLYFVIDTEPPYESRFAASYEEHQKNCKDMGY